MFEHSRLAAHLGLVTVVAHPLEPETATLRLVQLSPTTSLLLSMMVVVKVAEAAASPFLLQLSPKQSLWRNHSHLHYRLRWPSQMQLHSLRLSKMESSP
jgi:hypothetical protein